MTYAVMFMAPVKVVCSDMEVFLITSTSGIQERLDGFDQLIRAWDVIGGDD